MSPVQGAPSYPYVHERLDNGLRVLVQEDHTLPLVAVNVWYGVGSRHETPGRTGLAHLFEHLMFEGSAHVAKGEHFRLVNSAGGTLNATTSSDRTNYYETLPSNHLQLALWLEADRMGGLLEALNQETLDNQRAVVQNERRQRVDNQPYGQWLDLMHELAFPASHPYHHSPFGSMADLESATLDDVRNFHVTHYGPDNAVLTVVGDVSPGEALEQVHRFFGAIPARPSVPEVAPPGELAPSGEQRQVVLDEVPAIRLFVGYRCPAYSSADFPALTLLSVVLGGGRGSRLYRSLVIERELAQPAGGVLADQLPLVHGNGLLLCDVLGREGVPLAALEEGFEAVVQQTDGMAGDEIERARALLVAEWLHRLSSFERRADAFGEAVCLFDDADRVSTQLSRLVSTTAENVQRIAERVLVPANRVVLPFLPKDADDEAGSGR